jgi:hypothetical protein
MESIVSFCLGNISMGFYDKNIISAELLLKVAEKEEESRGKTLF